MKKQISMTIDGEVYEKGHKLAKAKDRSFSSLVQNLVKRAYHDFFGKDHKQESSSIEGE